MKEKVCLEAAQAEFDRFVEGMGLDVDLEGMDADEAKEYGKLKRVILKAIQAGHLVINDNDEAVYTPHREASKYSTPITFHERTGRSALAMDGTGKNQGNRKAYASMAQICQIPAKIIHDLAGPDIRVCEAVFLLLMD